MNYEIRNMHENMEKGDGDSKKRPLPQTNEIRNSKRVSVNLTIEPHHGEV
jgi:hypothetical protein